MAVAEVRVSLTGQERHMAKDQTEAEKQTHVLGSVRNDFPEDRYCSMIKITVSWGILKLRKKIIGKMKKKGGGTHTTLSWVENNTEIIPVVGGLILNSVCDSCP